MRGRERERKKENFMDRNNRVRKKHAEKWIRRKDKRDRVEIVM